MKKNVTGALAGVVAVALLTGGSTFAVWSDADNVNGGVVTAGNLDVAATSLGWFDTSADRVDIQPALVPFSGSDAHPIDDIGTWRMVPGDCAEYAVGLDVALEGDNLISRIQVDGFEELAPVDGEQWFTASYTVYDEAGVALSGMRDIPITGDGPADTWVFLQADSVGQAGGIDDAGIPVVSDDTLDGVSNMGVVATVCMDVNAPERALTQLDLFDANGVTVSLDQVRSTDPIPDLQLMARNTVDVFAITIPDGGARLMTTTSDPLVTEDAFTFAVLSEGAQIAAPGSDQNNFTSYKYGSTTWYWLESPTGLWQTDPMPIYTDPRTAATTVGGPTLLNVGDANTFSYSDPVQAWDPVDGILTDQIVKSGDIVDPATPGVYFETFTVTNSAGVTTTATRGVTVGMETEEYFSPSIHGFPVMLDLGDPFFPGDAFILTGNVINFVGDTVDTNVPGVYTVNGSVTDASTGDTLTATSTVTVGAPTITVPGSPNLGGVYIGTSVPAGSPFDPFDGVTAVDPVEGDITDQVTVRGRVDTNMVGSQYLEYSVTNSAGVTSTVLRVVEVQEASAVPSLNVPSYTHLTVGEWFDPMSGVTAVDAEDGYLTERVAVYGYVDTSTPGSYALTYEVTDSDGNTVTAWREVSVGSSVDYAPNVFAPDVRLALGGTFNPLTGVDAWDSEDGDVTSQVVVVNNPVDTSVTGTYYVQYEVTDSAGNVGTGGRTVTVYDPSVPQFTFPEGGNWAYEAPVGTVFDPLAGVTAMDAEDGDVSSEVVVTGDTVDTSTPWVSFYLTYTVTDSDGNVGTADRTIFVTDGAAMG